MSIQILGPEGPHPVENFPHQYIVRTRVPKDRFEIDMLVKRFRGSAVRAGDTVTVQLTTYAYDQLLYEGTFRVVERTDRAAVQEMANYEMRQYTDTTIRIEQVGGWWASELAPKEEAAPAGYWRAAEHAGRGKYRVVDSEGATLATGLDKDEAEAIARGDVPVTEAA